ncbi:unnamed protein product, partial [Discosporangium mesarthrocarpum]
LGGEGLTVPVSWVKRTLCDVVQAAEADDLPTRDTHKLSSLRHAKVEPVPSAHKPTHRGTGHRRQGEVSCRQRTHSS